MKFRKKPVVIEAWRNYTGDPEIDGAPGLAISLPPWMEQAYLDGSPPYTTPTGALIIRTLEGEMRADVGDWIIRGVKGELYPCKPDIFAATYEPVPDRAGGE